MSTPLTTSNGQSDNLAQSGQVNRAESLSPEALITLIPIETVEIKQVNFVVNIVNKGFPVHVQVADNQSFPQ